MSQSSVTLWKEHLVNEWKDLGIPKFLEQIGVNFEINFMQPLANTSQTENYYRNHNWIHMENIATPFGVLHLCPKLIEKEQVFWEEWFLLEDGIHHHVLSNQPFPSEEGVWRPELSDTDHPKIVLNHSWHYQIDQNLQPVGFR